VAVLHGQQGQRLVLGPRVGVWVVLPHCAHARHMVFGCRKEEPPRRARTATGYVGSVSRQQRGVGAMAQAAAVRFLLEFRV